MRKQRICPKLDAFAELLAEEVSPRDAAEKLGLPRECGDQMMVRLRHRLGDQAR